MGGGWNGASGPRAPPKEAVPEHFDCTSTVAGLFVVCPGAVRCGAVIGGHLDDPEVRLRFGLSRLLAGEGQGGPSQSVW